MSLLELGEKEEEGGQLYVEEHLGEMERVVWVNVPLKPGLSVKWALSDLLFAAMSVTAVRKVWLRRAEVLS